MKIQINPDDTIEDGEQSAQRSRKTITKLTFEGGQLVLDFEGGKVVRFGRA